MNIREPQETNSETYDQLEFRFVNARRIYTKKALIEEANNTHVIDTSIEELYILKYTY